jgi:anaerobilin synthase
VALELTELDHPSLRDLDTDFIRAQWQALAPPYDVERWRIPLPVWATRAYDDDDGPGAWRVLREDLLSKPASHPMCIYIHVPFCSSKCSFCDCYSFALPPRHEEHKKRYVRLLCEELALWAAQGNLGSRPVSTVHLGGGTPTYLGPELLTVLAEACRSNFNTGQHTEWALESTVEGLSPAMIGTMQELGFDRLHIGVQSLEDPVRQLIGRRRPAGEVLAKIDETLRLDWTVSVDMVSGLPLQTIPSFRRDISTLIAAGVNGVSLYELLIYPQNQRWARQQGFDDRSHLPNYLMFQVAAAVLDAAGYRKNTFNHWADERDSNRYFTFPTRGEDCLAVGTIADGVFGDYHFRHPRYAAYLRSATPLTPGLDGGLRRTAAESEMQPVTTAILSGRIPAQLAPRLRRRADKTPLAQRWIDLGLVAQDDDGGLQLLTNGSWFAGNMIQDYASLYPEHIAQR